MFAHVTIRTEDRAASERFYRTVLGALQIEPTHDTPDIIAWDDFAIIAADPGRPPTRYLHVAFVGRSREGQNLFAHIGEATGFEAKRMEGGRIFRIMCAIAMEEEARVV